MQLLTMYLNFVAKLVEAGIKLFVWSVETLVKAIIWAFERFDDKQRERQWKKRRRR